jgi:ATP-dependent 26S proteasome regulatory subunit
LNVIDGIVDTPGRMLVMTTNHPEKLDPALIRPGRVNMKICLGYMQSKEIIEMVTFYKGEVSPEQAAELRAPANITPAAVEQVCISSDTVDDVIADINNWVV